MTINEMRQPATVRLQKLLANVGHDLVNQGVLEGAGYHSTETGSGRACDLDGCKLVILAGTTSRRGGRLNVIDLVIAYITHMAPMLRPWASSQVPPMSGMHMIPLMGTRPSSGGAVLPPDALQAYFR